MHKHAFIRGCSDGSCQLGVYLVGDLDVLVAEAWSRPGWMRLPGLSEYTRPSCIPSWPLAEAQRPPEADTRAVNALIRQT